MASTSSRWTLIRNGDLDIALSTGADTADPDAGFVTKHPNQLLVNDGAGGLHDAGVSWSSQAEATITMTAGDIDGDGLSDLVLCNFGTANRVFLQRAN